MSRREVQDTEKTEGNFGERFGVAAGEVKVGGGTIMPKKPAKEDPAHERGDQG